jgi:hypothetical protein
VYFRHLLNGDALLVGEVGFADGPARTPSRSSAMGTVGFERRHNRALQLDSEDAFVAALTEDIPPAPEQQAAIVAANRSGRPPAEVS